MTPDPRDAWRMPALIVLGILVALDAVAVTMLALVAWCDR